MVQNPFPSDKWWTTRAAWTEKFKHFKIDTDISSHQTNILNILSLIQIYHHIWWIFCTTDLRTRFFCPLLVGPSHLSGGHPGSCPSPPETSCQGLEALPWLDKAIPFRDFSQLWSSLLHHIKGMFQKRGNGFQHPQCILWWINIASSRAPNLQGYVSITSFWNI